MTTELPTLKIGVAFLLLLIGGCVFPENTEQITLPAGVDDVVTIPKIVKQPCLDYSNINYTTIQISEEDFKNLSCFRQRDWLTGTCYPEDCKEKNPPVCVAEYLVNCYNPDSEVSKYFRYREIQK